MKKNLVLAIAAAVVVMGMLFNSCKQTPTTKVALVTEADSLSYSFGASVGENLEGALLQMGIVADTATVYGTFMRKISSEQDASKKTSLEKEMRQKIDSINKANEYAVAQFLQGFEAAANSRPSQYSYNFGFSVGTQVAKQGEMVEKQFFEEGSGQKVNNKAVVAAITASILKKQPAMANAQGYIMMKSSEMQQKEMNKMQAKGENNRKAGEDFLNNNKSKRGVITLPSGVQYKVLAEGKGPKPSATDRVKCHYHGTLIDGTVFDSSVDRGEPTDFGVNQVIPGWTEILQLMPVGSKWEVYIPYNMAYGEQGAGGEILPYSALVFQVELLEILK